MKIGIINGSPRAEGNTYILSAEFARGAMDAGNDVEIISLCGKQIKGCLGCKYCYTHKGECVQKDDMQNIMEKLAFTDMVVFASPIYWFDITAQLKAVIDRMYAFGSIGFHFNKTALLLNSGADHVYTAAIAQYKAMTGYLKWEDKGIITVPGMTEKGSMESSPALKEAYQLGFSLN